MNALSEVVETAVPTENLPAESVETPGVTEPETPDGEQAQPELTEAEKKMAQLEKESKAKQRRIDRLTREKYQTRGELEQMRQQRPAAGEEQSAGQQTQQQIHQQARALVEAERVAAKCNDIHAAGTKAFPDFLDKFSEVHADMPLFDQNQRPTAAMEAILDADNPAALIHHLGSNPDLAAELADMNPRQQIRRIALIERDIGSKPTPKPSNAPKPLTPVKSTAGSAGPNPEKDPEGWVAWRNAQVKSR